MACFSLGSKERAEVDDKELKRKKGLEIFLDAQQSIEMKMKGVVDENEKV